MVLVKSLAGVRVLPKPVFAEQSDNYILSPEQIKFYEDNGFLVIKELIDFTSLYSYKQRFIQMCKGIVPVGNVRVIKEPTLVAQNLKPEEYINKIQELLYDDVFIQYGEHPRLLSVLSQFIGDDITAVNSMFINKPPGASRHPPHQDTLIGDDITAVNSMFINKPPGASRHPPHQDLFYFPFRPAEKIIGAWTAVDHVTVENGCLYAVPGSHKAAVLYQHQGKKDALKLYHGVDEEAIAPLDQRVHLEMSPGDTVFLHPYLLHGSGPNVSKNYRKAITFHFANSSCEYIDLRGTVQEHLAKEVEAHTVKMGFGELSYIDVWRLKSKQVKGVRSNL
ncbi:probable phytanoyl-CoA dioxygenase isoform X5 [Spodoptera frugiperda]|uniref:phytanoyl-CoA dioxygenase n=1 Tax=Spodoptera frugiperda TaxID=7108 RepID=A0A9R0DW59_SPOFR|nr:probable phytanoyl-CoA dioxygenase isoform X2 [Spodoptera frugiperda]XP_050554394.1 probable phytanoyl-CoA dioxygenase isoform X3 [Spodoptera frugiperda]XP_050554395.1 probable phytanoyl-CoA dioxygenase isoform X4 [Spodoptera frugiperda]XP_050554396.1 probable phytanoyl-CoA dioxygenase isoform X5 [Spodoptera frugiperda]